MIRVVVVDDEAVARRGIVMGVDWAKLGCEIAGEAASGEEGVALVSRVAPDLIITDIRMPHMDGIEMMNELRKRGCRAHVIVLSAYSDFSYARSALKFGADDYLLKPFREGELENAVSGVLRRERAENVKKRNVFAKYGGEARALLEALLETCADSGISEIEDMDILKLDPFVKFGKPAKIAQLFGGREGYIRAVRELESEIYKAA